MLRPETEESPGFTHTPCTRPPISTCKIALASACLSPACCPPQTHRGHCASCPTGLLALSPQPALLTAAGIIFVNHKLHPISLLLRLSTVLRLKKPLLARSLRELAPAILASFHATNSLAHCLAATEITIIYYLPFLSFVTIPRSFPPQGLCTCLECLLLCSSPG